MKKEKKILIIIGSIVGGIAVIIASTIGIMAATSYKADSEAISLLSDPKVTDKGNSYFVESSSNSDVGVVFYPGARVNPESYLPLMKKISEYNINVCALKVFMNFAFTEPNKADIVFENYKNIKKWYVMGHSLGGSIASQYASSHQNKVSGLILLGAYPYKEYPLSNTLTIYGSLDSLSVKNITYTENVVRIEGGNHCYFGNYGQQSGDPVGTISREEQQNITAFSVNEFINNI